MESEKQAGHDGLGGRSNGSIANNDFVQFFFLEMLGDDCGNKEPLGCK